MNGVEECDETAVECGEVATVFMAGHKARPGVYRQLESRRRIVLESEDYLPASLDGRVTCYICIQLREYHTEQM